MTELKGLDKVIELLEVEVTNFETHLIKLGADSLFLNEKKIEYIGKSETKLEYLNNLCAYFKHIKDKEFTYGV